MNTGQIFKCKANRNYTKIPNSMIQNKELSMDAKCLCAYLLSLPEDWVVNKTSLPDHFIEGKHRVYNAFDELIERGYILRTEIFNGNLRAGYNYIVYDEPTLSDPRTAEIRTSETRTAEDQPLQSKQLTKERITKKTYIYIVPSVDEVKAYFLECGYRADVAVKAFEYYQCADWHDSKGQRVKNWKQKMRGVWFKPENKITTESKIKSGKPLL
jgi:hypothetical protein